MRRSEEGSVLVFAAIMVTILMGLTLLLLQGAVGESMSLDGDFDASISLSAAEGGLEMTLKTINTLDFDNITATSYGVDADWGGSDDANSNTWPDFGETDVTGLDIGTGQFISYTKVTTDAADPNTKYVTVRSIGGCEMHQAHGGAMIETVLETIIKVHRVITPIDSMVTGAVSVTAGDDEEGTYAGTLTANIHGHPSISGYDHDLDGNNLGTGEGVAGLAVNDGSGNPEWDVNQSGQPGFIEGPADFSVTIGGQDYAINNDAAWNGDQLQEVVQAAIASPDIYVGPGEEEHLTNANENIGAPDDYKVMHVDVQDSDSTALWLAGHFEGYGLLVVTIDGAQSVPVIDMQGRAQWTGMIIIVCGENTTLTGRAIDLRGGGNTENVLLGSTAFLVQDGASLEQGGAFVDIRGNPDIHYSSQAVRNALDAAGLNNITITATRLFTYYRVR